MSTKPLVSVVILNHKRLQELERCLDSVLRQDWPELEIIVVDNHSEEDVASVVRRKSDAIRLIELPSNLGACAGRNAGIREAHGDILVSLDNDVSFESAHEVTRIVAAFAENPDFHVLALRICDAGTGALRVREWCHPRDWRAYHDRPFESDFFGEGASAFRREVFEVAGLYWEPLFIGCEGWDLTMRILSHGFRILYCPDAAVRHSMSAECRPSARPFYYYTRNYIWIAWRNYPVAAGLAYAVPKVGMMLIFSLRARRLGAFFRGLKDGVAGLRRIGPREPLRRRDRVKLISLESTRPGILLRIARHVKATQL